MSAHLQVLIINNSILFCEFRMQYLMIDKMAPESNAQGTRQLKAEGFYKHT